MPSPKPRAPGAGGTGGTGGAGDGSAPHCLASSPVASPVAPVTNLKLGQQRGDESQQPVSASMSQGSRSPGRSSNRSNRSSSSGNPAHLSGGPLAVSEVYASEPPPPPDLTSGLDRDSGRVTGKTFRERLGDITSSQRFEALMGVIIISNMLMIMWETDYRAQCYPNWADDFLNCPYDPDKDPWAFAINWLLLIVYTVEAASHIYVHRLQYFANRWNLIDFAVVFAGWGTLAIGTAVNIGFMRVFRMVRLMRAFRIVLSVRELYMLLTGLASSFKAIFFGTMLLFMMLVLWSIVLVELVNPVNSVIQYEYCERCHRGFASIADSCLTLFQTIIAGDSWGQIHVRVIEARPLLSVILVCVVLSVSLGIMNLILAVIVESAAEARENDIEEKAKIKLRDQCEVKGELLHICKQMDKDGSKSISLAEMEAAFEDSIDFRRIMLVLDIEQKDVSAVHRLLDRDNTGEVDYEEFVEAMYDLRTGDMRMMLAMTNMKIDEMSQNNTYRQEEHARTVEEALASQGSLLCSMNARMGRLIDSPAGSTGSVAVCSALPQHKATVFDRPEPPGWPEPEAGGRRGWLDSTSGAATAPADVAAELESLQLHLEELSGLNKDLVRRADENASTLKRHVSLLSSVRKAMPECGEKPSLSVSQHVGSFRTFVRDQLRVVLKDLEERLDCERSALAAGGRLLEGLAQGLDLPLSACHDAKATLTPPGSSHLYRNDNEGPTRRKSRARSASPPCPGGSGQKADFYISAL